MAPVTVRGRWVWIGGIDLAYTSADATEAVAEPAAVGEDDDLRVLVAHRPDAGYVVGELDRIDLVVAGHTHGGQVAVPVLGPLITLSDVPRSVGASGLHDLAGEPIYVGTGVGPIT